MESFIRRYHQTDINVITDSPVGLLTPIVRDAGSVGLKYIAKVCTADDIIMSFIYNNHKLFYECFTLPYLT